MPADLFSMTAPLVIRLPSGERRVMAEYFPHPRGLLFFDLFWHMRDADDAIHVIEGELKGDGPWKIGACVVTVLGCHGSDPQLAGAFAQWQSYRQMSGEEYPDAERIRALARAHGADA